MPRLQAFACPPDLHVAWLLRSDWNTPWRLTEFLRFSRSIRHGQVQSWRFRNPAPLSEDFIIFIILKPKYLREEEIDQRQDGVMKRSYLFHPEILNGFIPLYQRNSSKFYWIYL